MTEDTAITDRLRTLGDELEDDVAVETIVLEDSAIMPTAELEQLLDPDSEPDES